MTTRFSIGEFSKASGISPKTLRFYHDRGILVPAAIDQATGYRFYDEISLERAQIMLLSRRWISLWTRSRRFSPRGKTMKISLRTWNCGRPRYVEAEETIPKWNALITVGLMADSVHGSKARALLPRLFELLEDASMVTTGHVVTCLRRLAAAKPRLRPEIVARMLKIEGSSRNPGCNEILADKVLKALITMAPDFQAATRESVIEFAANCAESSRSTTRTLADKLEKRLKR